MPKKYPLEFKKQAIRRYKKGESIPALCHIFTTASYRLMMHLRHRNKSSISHFLPKREKIYSFFVRTWFFSGMSRRRRASC